MHNLGISYLEIWMLLKQMTLSDYLFQLTQMPVNKKGTHKAPHKAMLLLAVCDLIESSIITNNFIPIDDNLIRAFKSRWRKHVPLDSPFSCRLCYPFYHLSSSAFWHLVISPEFIKNKEYSSITALKRSFIGATIDYDLFEFIKNPSSRKQIIQILTSTYL